MAETFSFDYFGSTMTAELLGTAWTPPIQETLSSHCVPLTPEGKIVAVNVIGRGIDIPGGHIDDGETAIEALQRETWEEAQITITHPVLIDVWRLSSANVKLGLVQKPYLLVYSGRVESVSDFNANEEVDARLMLEPSEFVEKYFGNKRQAKIMIDKAIAAQGQFSFIHSNHPVAIQEF